jgi:nicotinamide riboside transporter PnuC
MGFATSIQQQVCLAGYARLYTLWSWAYQADAYMTGHADHMLQDKMLLLLMVLLLFHVVQMLICCTIMRRLDAQGSRWCGGCSSR